MSTVFKDSSYNPQAGTPGWISPPKGQQIANINTAGNNHLLNGSNEAQVVLSLSVNTGVAASTVKIYDGTSAAGTLLGTYTSAAQAGQLLPPGGFQLAVGLFVVTVGTADITITYI
jgi:hypothetical protein